MSTYTLQPGTTFKTRVYRIERVTNQDGISITYVARFLQTQVIIKEFFPQGSIRAADQSVEPQSLAREQFIVFKNQYLQEADKISQYDQHPNLHHITDVFQENNTTYYVQPYLEGMNLEEYCKANTGKLSVEESEPIIQQIAQAITALHKQKIIHGDIQPENIFITRAGNAVLTGLAPQREAVLKEILQHSLIHSPGYSPPEMFDYEAKRGSYSDVYAFAATIYRTLGGQRPVPAETRQIRTLIPLGNYNSSVPKNIESAIHKGMALHPQERFPTIADFLGALDMGQRGETTTAFPKSEGSEIRFDALITEADRLFLEGDYVRARRSYEEARQIHPDDSFIRGRITECNNRLQESATITNPPVATSSHTGQASSSSSIKETTTDKSHVSMNKDIGTAAVATVVEEEEEKEKKGGFWWWLPFLILGVLLLWLSGIFGGDKNTEKPGSKLADQTERIEPVMPTNNNRSNNTVNATDSLGTGGVSTASNPPWGSNGDANNTNGEEEVPVTNSVNEDDDQVALSEPVQQPSEANENNNNNNSDARPTTPPPTPVAKPTPPAPKPAEPTPPPPTATVNTSGVKVVKHKPGNIKSGSVSRGYYVIVGAFKDKSNANRIATKLKNDGLSAKLIPLANGYYRVGVPSSGSKEKAKQLAARCRGYNKDAWVLDYN